MLIVICVAVAIVVGGIIGLFADRVLQIHT